jgi:hypothetical protein
MAAHYADMAQQCQRRIHVRAVELDAERARAAKALLGETNVLHAAIEGVSAVGQFGIVWLNPPYDQVSGGRAELLWVRMCAPFVGESGMAVERYLDEVRSDAVARTMEGDYHLMAQYTWANLGAWDVASVGDEVDGHSLPPIACPGDLWLKEEALLRLIAREKRAGRKVLCFVGQINRRDPTGRLYSLLECYGMRGQSCGPTKSSASSSSAARLKAGPIRRRTGARCRCWATAARSRPATRRLSCQQTTRARCAPALRSFSRHALGGGPAFLPFGSQSRRVRLQVSARRFVAVR